MSSFPIFLLGPLVLLLIVSLLLSLIQMALGIQLSTATYYQIHVHFLLISALLWIYSPLPDITMGMMGGASGEYWGIRKVDLLLVIVWGVIIGILLLNPDLPSTLQ